MRSAALGLAGLAAGIMLCGCGAQDEVIGEGPASLVFRNEGTGTIEVQVRWTDDTGTERRRSFDLESTGKVEVRLADQLEYRIALDAQCNSTAAGQAPATAEPRVITVGQNGP